MTGPTKRPLVWSSWPPAPKRPYPAPEDQKKEDDIAAVDLSDIETENYEAPAAEKSANAAETADQTNETAVLGAIEQEEDSPAIEIKDEPAVALAIEDPVPEKKPAAPEMPADERWPHPTKAPDYGNGAMPDMQLATAYIPYQMYGTTYSPAEALARGTLFPALYRPYPN